MSGVPEDRGVNFRALEELFAEFILKTYARRLSAYSGETLRITGARPAGHCLDGAARGGSGGALRGGSVRGGIL